VSDSSASWDEFKRLAEDLGAGIVEIPPTEYEASVTAAFDEKRNVVLDVIANGPPIAEVRRTSKGLLWVSVFQGSQPATSSQEPLRSYRALCGTADAGTVTMGSARCSRCGLAFTCSTTRSSRPMKGCWRAVRTMRRGITR
jgi:hypothetical protein